MTVEDMRRKVVDVFLDAYGEKLYSDETSCTVCCTTAAQSGLETTSKMSLSAAK